VGRKRRWSQDHTQIDDGMNLLFKYATHTRVNKACGSLEITGMAYWVDPIIKGKDIRQ
jgi:hypothetical protein